MQIQDLVRRELYFSHPQTLALSQRSLDKSLPFHKPILSLLLQYQAQLGEGLSCGLSCTPPLLDGEPDILRKVMAGFAHVREFPPTFKNILTDILDCRGTKLLVFAGEEKRGRPKALKDWEKKFEWLWTHQRYSAFKTNFSRIPPTREEDQGERVTLLTRQALNKIKPTTSLYNLHQNIFSGFDPKKITKESWFSFVKDQPELGGGFSAHLISDQPFAGASRITLTSYDLLIETSFSQAGFFNKIGEVIDQLLKTTKEAVHVRLASPSLALNILLGEVLHQRFYLPKSIRSLDQAMIGKVIAPCLSFLALLNSKAGSSLYISMQAFPDVQLVLIEQEKK